MGYDPLITNKNQENIKLIQEPVSFSHTQVFGYVHIKLYRNQNWNPQYPVSVQKQTTFLGEVFMFLTRRSH
jgi:hypothetical protein